MRVFSILFLPLLGLVSMSSWVARAAAPSGYYLVWSDEFNGTALDGSKWDNWLLGNRRDAVNTGAAVSVGGGVLTLSTYTVGGTHYTGMISTDGKFRPRYGYLESSIDFDSSPGMWSAFWMQSPGMGSIIGNVADSGAEIDVAEHRSTDGSSDISGQVQVNIHWDGYGGDHKSTGSGNVGSGLASGYHTYGWLWEDWNNYKLFVDGTQRYSTGSGVSRRSEFIVLSSEVQNGSWAGSIPAGGYGTLAATATKMKVDYVRWYAPDSQVFWLGTGGNPSWTTAANWKSSNGRVPGAADELVFSTLTTANNSSLPGAGSAANKLTFLDDGSAFTLSGGSVTLGAGGIELAAGAPTVTINSPLTLAANQTWTVGPWGALVVNGPVTGGGTLTKAGLNLVVLSGDNPFTGTLNVGTGSGSAKDGRVRITRSEAIANAKSPIYIANNNSGESTLQLQASGAPITVPQILQLSCRNNAGLHLQNEAGDNVLAGGIDVTQGGSNVWIQSDSGTLSINGNLRYVGSLSAARSYTFQGAGDIVVNGPILHPANGAPISLVKNDAGSLTLSNFSTVVGDSYLNGGTLRLAHANALQNSTLQLDPATAGTLVFDGVTGANLGGLSGSRNLFLANAAGDPVRLSVGKTGASTGFGGVLDGPGGLTKIGTGRLTLGGTNTYTDSTVVQAGTLALGPNAAYAASREPQLRLAFESVSGSTVLNTGKGGATFNGTITGSGVSVAGGGRYGNALNLTGAGGYLRIASPVVDFNGGAGGNWTLAMWIKTTQAGACLAYQGSGGWTWDNTVFYLNQGNTTSGTRVGGVRYGRGWLTGARSVNNGQWRFITIAVQNGVKRIYVDGTLDAVVPAATGWTGAGAGGEFWIGGSGDGGDGVQPMNGMIDEVAVFDRPLDAQEIAALMNDQPLTCADCFVGQLPQTTQLSVFPGAAFDLGGVDQAVASLTGIGMVTNSGAAPVVLTLAPGLGETNVFAGMVADSAGGGAMSLVKSGSGHQTLAGANSYRGPTTILAGTLRVDGALGTNWVNVSGGTLAGSGVIGGSVVVSGVGRIAPGASIGKLTVNGDVALGGISELGLDRAAGTNDVLRVGGALHLGGTLAVTNLSGAVVAGDRFPLFEAGSIDGQFAAVTPSVPGAGLKWDFTEIGQGILKVAAANPPPAISGTVVRPDGNFEMTGTGPANALYELQTATDLLAPIQWLFLTNGSAGPDGVFRFTDLDATNHPQRFYRVVE